MRRFILTIFGLLSCHLLHAEPTATPSSVPVAGSLPAKENFHIYLLMGQSNMAGRDTSKLDAQVDNPQILMLDAAGQWVVARDPMFPVQGRTKPGAGPGIPFAAEMLKANPKVTIGLVPLAVGGSGLKHWEKNGDYYVRTLVAARAVAGVGTISGVLWHQGETDATKQATADTYEARLTKMFGDLRQDLGQPELPIVVGQIGGFLDPKREPAAETVRAAIKHLPTVVPRVGFADSDGLTDKGDKLHFTADSQKEMGARFAKAMQALQK
ncbi:MAG: sialate O-acetylesterase [Chthoniobacteraceae bacterium]